MKTLLLLSMLFSLNAFALHPCEFEMTQDFRETLNASGIKPLKVSRAASKFRFIEKQMIHLTISLQEWLSGISRNEAIELFVEDHNDGEILYYNLDGKDIALVHYYPGDNEYGAFVELKGSAFILLAEIRDSDIYCN